jgi:outer membrane receptor for ferrienterochelin and colicins
MTNMLFRPRPLALAIACLLPQLASAQTTAAAGDTSLPPKPAAKPAIKSAAKPVEAASAPAPMQTVQVRGAAAAYDARRDDTASKTVLDAEEIRKYGDTNIFDVLKRAPGVTITGGNVLRMRGLGAGYTQILVNGDRPPPGFSLDTLTPDQIERIEIVKAASAEYSMQAIAGTINIVLRKLVVKPQRDARIATNRTPQNRGLNLSGTYGERVGSVSYFLNGSAWAGSSEFTQTSEDQMTDPNGAVTQARTGRYEGQGPYRGLVLFPRVSWKVDDKNELNLSVGVQADSSSWQGSSHNDVTVGSFGDPDWIDSDNHSTSSHWMYRGEANWVAKIAGGKLEVTVSGERRRNDSDQFNDQTNLGATQELTRDWDDVQHNSRVFARAKFTRSVFDDHALGTGFEASRQDNDETRVRRERQTGLPDTDIVETFDPRLTRVAGYVQDEWNILPRWSMYLGGRWEGIETDSAAGAAGVESDTVSRSHVLSPVLQTLYKLPGAKQQVRLALTRTYKAPSTDQLTARRYVAAENTRFSPDSSGNPALRPELANGIDLAFESFWAPGALMAVTASQRDITDFIRTRLDVGDDGRWLVQPLNDGDATVRSLEAELKLPLQLLFDAAKGIDLRASVTRNWSEVSTVPGPDNRLDAQTPESATFGIDYRRDRLSLGASLAYQQGGWVRISDAQSARQQTRKDLDAYALWKLDEHFQLRLSLANILGMDNTSERSYDDASGLSRQWSYQRGWMRTGLNLEMKL